MKLRKSEEIWAPDKNIQERVERLKRERVQRCARGQHEDPDNSGSCINCGYIRDKEEA